MGNQYASYVLTGEVSVPPASSAIFSSKRVSRLSEPLRTCHSRMGRASEPIEQSLVQHGLFCMLSTHLKSFGVKLQ